MRGSATGFHDGSGLRTAIEETDDGQVHFARNLQGRVGRKDRVQPAVDQRAGFAAPDGALALARQPY